MWLILVTGVVIFFSYAHLERENTGNKSDFFHLYLAPLWIPIFQVGFLFCVDTCGGRISLTKNFWSLLIDS